MEKTKDMQALMTAPRHHGGGGVRRAPLVESEKEDSSGGQTQKHFLSSCTSNILIPSSGVAKNPPVGPGSRKCKFPLPSPRNLKVGSDSNLIKSYFVY